MPPRHAARSMVLVGLLAGACAAPAPPAPTLDAATPAASAATAAPSATASASQSTVSAALGDRLRRSTTELVVGAGPEGDADAVGIRAGTLTEGAAVWVLDETADRSWALVAAVDGAREADMLLGWIPLNVEGASSLEPVPLACPAPPLGVEALAGLGRLGGLACYGGERIELIGFTPTGCGAGGSSRSGTPEWLNGTWTAVGIGASEPVPPDFDVSVQVSARVAPDAALQAGCGAPGWFRFVGHFDHPAAETCRTTLDEGAGPVVIEPRISVLLCRAQLVLSEAHRLARAP